MFIVTVLYPVGASLDLEYYENVHLPLVRKLLVPAGMNELVYWQPTIDNP